MLIRFNMKKLLAFILFIFLNTNIYGQQLQTNISVHDPVMLRQDSVYYVFCTGNGIAMWSSTDRVNWKHEKPVFDTAPQWAIDKIPGFENHVWAPDISYYNGLYYLYYAVSVFGKNISAIGVATNKTLHTNSPDYGWTDHGMVIQSLPGKTNWNAIDPNLITDDKGIPYLAFGSFWDGIKIVRLSKDRFSVAEDITKLPTIASRKTDSAANTGANAIEAPFVFKKGNYFYLFASIDYCCKGPQSTYKMIVGRSKNVTGPYTDKKNLDMAHGGGSIILAGDKNWYGVGHNAVVDFDGTDYIIFHGYDASDNGRSKLRIEQLDWDSAGWPVVMVH